MNKQRLTKEEFLNKYPNLINEEQLNNLEFDYFNRKYPEKKKLPEKDINYLFIELNLSVEEISELCGCTVNKVRISARFYNFKKTNEQRQIVLKRTCMRKYGVEHPHQLPEIRERVYKTNLEKYGTYCSSKANKVKEKQAQTCLERYGTKSALQNEQIRKKSKRTCIEKYGVDNVSKSKEVIIKIKAKVPETLKKMENTCMRRYGAKSFWKSKYMDWDKAKENIRKTAKENGSYGKSKPEEEIYKKLMSKFKEVLRQYYDAEKYPFLCDFYIPKLDLFIEYQGYWTHGKHPFDKNDTKDMKLIEEFKNKKQEHPLYEAAIKTWTIRDVKKRQTAKENNLNWIEFFNMKEFNDWFNSL